ncbi:hypothetical protein TNCV_1062781 [Trichonephila clavipes]|nr:hypothetical protein TNCV_1062781 [Trichonephila clavipes]
MNDMDSQQHQNSEFKRRVTVHGDLCSERKAVTLASGDGRRWSEKCKAETPPPSRSPFAGRQSTWGTKGKKNNAECPLLCTTS